MMEISYVKLKVNLMLQKIYTQVFSLLYFAGDVVRYPKFYGLTGRALRDGVIISNLGKADPFFDEEVDETIGTGFIDNIVIIPLWLNTNLMGVLQLVNYKEKEITSTIIILFFVMKIGGAKSCSGDYK